MRFSVGYELTEQVRAAILQIPEDAWVPALDQDGIERENGEVCEITDMVDLSAWPEGSRLIVRRERPHPGAQLSLHRPRRLPLPSDPHRPDRPRHRRARVPPPPARARRGPHPRRQGHRPVQVPVQRVRAQRGVAGDRRCSRTTCSSGPKRSSSTASSPKPNPSESATGCCTSPAGSRSPAAARSSTSKTHGRGRPSSSPRSRNSKRSRPRAADSSRQRPHHHQADRPATRPRSPLPGNEPSSPPRARGNAEHHQQRPTTRLTHHHVTRRRRPRHIRALTARSGLEQTTWRGLARPCVVPRSDEVRRSRTPDLPATVGHVVVSSPPMQRRSARCALPAAPAIGSCP